MREMIVCRELIVVAAMAYFAISAATVSAQLVIVRTVNTTSDTIAANACVMSNPCSLRAAMTGITADVTIVFNIPTTDPFCSAGVCTINFSSSLPSIIGTNIAVAGPGADRLIIKPAMAAVGRPFFVSSTSGVVTISGLTIKDASTPGALGGAIAKTGNCTLVISDVVLNNNSGSAGGAIYIAEGTVNLLRSTLSSNTALMGVGGAIRVLETAICNVTNTLITNNRSLTSGGGGISSAGTTNVSNSTIVGNSASVGGGIIRESPGGSVSVKSTIIALNSTTTSGPDGAGTFISAGFNLIGKIDGTSGFTASTDLKGTVASPLDPLLDPSGIQSNGGPTRTVALLGNSPAIDKGSSAGLTGVLTTDQRSVGFARTRDNPLTVNAVGGDGTDIGSYERHTYSTFDFEGDGRSDIGIFRPTGGEWWINRSLDGSTFALQFGVSTDRITPADFTGDGRTDIAFWRPGTGQWFVLRSEDFSFFAFGFGTNGDVPAPGDFDGDRKADAAIFRPSTGTWFILRSTGPLSVEQFGTNGDIPVAADYDGDGRTDIAIYRPSNGQWWLNRSTVGVIAFTFGTSTDKVVPGDFTGDNKADVAFWRPSNGNWFVLRSEDSSFFGFAFGMNGDVPAPGDYDGDGKFDPTIFRPSNATWFSQRSLGGFAIQQFGANGDRPVANAFIP